MLIKTEDVIKELDTLEEMIEDEIDRLRKEGVTLEEAVKAGACLVEKYWRKKNADKSRS